MNRLVSILVLLWLGIAQIPVAWAQDEIDSAPQRSYGFGLFVAFLFVAMVFIVSVWSSKRSHQD